MLLFDENLSPRLVLAMAGMFPGSRHVEDCGLIAQADEQVWKYAQRNGFSIVTKVGNCTTSRAEFVFGNLSSRIQDFLLRGEDSCLILQHPRIGRP